MHLSLHVLGNAGCFDEVAPAFVQAAQDAGHGAAIVSPLTPQEGVNVYFIGYGGFLRDPSFRFAPGSVNVLYNFEQSLPSGYDRFDLVLTIFPHLCEGPIIPCPLGYSPLFDRAEGASDVEDIDVLHLGPLREGRKGEIGAELGPLVSAPTYYGAERDGLILRSRINLIVQPWPDYHLPVLRLLLLAGKRKFVLCDGHASYANIDPACLTLPQGSLSASIAHWLAAPAAQRQAIADAAHHRLKQAPAYAALVHDALALVARRLGES